MYAHFQHLYQVGIAGIRLVAADGMGLPPILGEVADILDAEVTFLQTPGRQFVVSLLVRA